MLGHASPSCERLGTGVEKLLTPTDRRMSEGLVDPCFLKGDGEEKSKDAENFFLLITSFPGSGGRRGRM